MEYQVFELDPTMAMCHIDAPPMFESNDLPMALDFAYKTHILLKKETCVWQPRTERYRDYYKNDEV